MEDKLKKIYDHQKELQESLGVYEKISGSEQLKQQYINQMLLACHEEVTEIMRETAYKNPDFVPFGWKKGQQFNEENFKEEIIDLIHFVMSLAIVSGMDSDEIFDRYIKKNKKNHKRQEDGY
jgi:dimeric dUTPase (all-alpha-NTP-PPase superfamily)